jgi:hypothetical protein
MDALDERTVKRRQQHAARMSRHRKRAREGVRTLRITISESDIDAFVRIGVLAPDQRDDDASVQGAIEALCKRGHRALVAERREAATRPQLSKANEHRLASLEETATSRPAKT